MTDELLVKLAGALPKGDLNGLNEPAVTETTYRRKFERRYQAPRVALIIYDVREAKAGKDGVDSVMYEVSRIEPVTTTEGRRLAETMLEDEYAARTGQAVPPYELAQLSKLAFADLPRTIDEVDEKESRERDLMSPTDELRRHLGRVHGVADAHLLTAEGADSKHDADHNGDALPEPLRHDPGWHGWTRADLEEAEVDADSEYADEPVADTLPLGEESSGTADEDRRDS